MGQKRMLVCTSKLKRVMKSLPISSVPVKYSQIRCLTALKHFHHKVGQTELLHKG